MSAPKDINDSFSLRPSSAGTVLIGDIDQPVSVDLLQRIYNEITGKRAKISDIYDDSILVEIEDIEQLNHIIIQTIKPYSPVSFKSSFSIFYAKKTREDFDSFENFKLHSAASTRPVEGILVKYDFLLINTDNRSNTYSISVRISSRLSVEKRTEEEFAGAPSALIRALGDRTANLDINYVNYTVAKSLQTNVGDWFHGLSKSPSNKFIKFLQKYSYWIPRISRLGTFIAFIIITIDVLPNFINENLNSLYFFSRCALYFTLGLFTAYTLSGWSGQYCENAIDRWSELSYVKLNKGDDAQIRESKNRNSRSIIRATFGFIGSTSISIGSKIVATLVVNYLVHH